MADNDQLLQQIRKVVREENEPLKQGQKNVEQGLADVKQDIQGVKQTQAQHGTILAQQKIILEAVAAGQKELQATVATKAD
jgi:hypothetical protein